MQIGVKELLSLGNLITLFINLVEYLMKIVSSVFLLFITIFVVLFCWNKKQNRKSIEMIDYTKNKYINSIYVELGNSEDKLRYFFYKRKWKSKIINDFKQLFYKKGHDLLLNQCDISIKSLKTTAAVKEAAKKCIEYIDKLKESQLNIDYYIENNTQRNLKNLLEEILENIELHASNVCMVVGNGGTGKTNLLINFATNIVLKDYRCMLCYMNAKDVNGKFEDYLKTTYPSSIQIEKNKLFCIIHKLFNFIFQRKTVIIIDGLNEKSDNEFYKSVCEYINSIITNKNIYLVMSTRKEFYDIRFKEIFECYLHNINDIKMISINNDDPRGKELFFEKYKKHFKFTGHISEYEKRKLVSTPIFARLFFDVHRNNSDNFDIINKNKVFNDYINIVIKRNNIKRDYITSIVDYMIDNKIYFDIEIDKIFDDEEIISALLDSELFISKEKVFNENEPNIFSKNVISFMFDEMRDYLLFVQLIERYSSNIKFLIDKIKELYAEKSEVMDGVFRNLYVYYKEKNNDICKLILSYDNSVWKGRNIYFDNRINYILESNKEINDFEKDFLDVEINHPNDIINLLLDFGYNDIYNRFPSKKYIEERIEHYLAGDRDIFDRLRKDDYDNIIKKLKKERNVVDNDYIKLIVSVRDKMYGKEDLY